MSPSLTHHPRCDTHPHTPLTTTGDCPRCALLPALAPEKPDTKHITRPPDKKAVAAKVAGRISAGKPRARRAA